MSIASGAGAPHIVGFIEGGSGGRGQVASGRGEPGRATQAQMEDVAAGATVALIETDTGRTVASTLSDSRGSFDLAIAGTFIPEAGKPYYLEAVKGLPAGGKPNRAGAAVARVRTLVVASGGWQSLTGGSGGISISRATTTVAILSSLEGLPFTEQLKLLGTVSGTDFRASGTAISASDYAAAFAIVSDAVLTDEDPVEAVGLDLAEASAALRFGRRPAIVTFLGTLDPPVGAPGGEVTFSGLNFPLATPSLPAIAVGGTPVATWSVNLTRDRLTVKLPGTAVSGPVTLTLGKATYTGPAVPLAGTVSTLAGGGAAGFADGTGAEALFNTPQGMGMDAFGNLIVADFRNMRVRKVTPLGVVTTIAGSGAPGEVDGVGLAAQFFWPGDCGITPDGNIWVSEYFGRRIRKIAPDGTVTTVAGNGTQADVDGTGTGASFNGPIGIKPNSAGDLIIAEYDGSKVRKMTPAGVVTTVAGGFNVSVFAAPHPNGNIYVADRNNNAIKVIAPGGGVSTLVALTRPYGITVEPSGHLLVCSYDRHVVERVTVPGGVVTPIAGLSGTAGEVDGPVGSSRINGPVIVLEDPTGHLIYVLEYDGNRIRVITQ